MTPPTFLYHVALAFSILGPLAETTADQDAGIGVISSAAAAKREATAHITKYRDRYSNFPATATERTKKNHFLYHHMYTVEDNMNTAKDHIKRPATAVGVDRMRYFNGSVESETDHSRGSRAKRQDVEPCDKFKFRPGMSYLTHPSINGETYTPNKDCFSLIATDPGKVIILDFVDVFHIEYHPDCVYDYLEIRDGMHGYSMLINKYCGNNFPPRIQSTGPYLWLKFHSDDTIEYEGFKISIRFEASATSKSIPVSCYINKTNEDRYGIISMKEIPDDCKQSNPMDVLWNITTPKNTKIHLNFTAYKLKFINDCTKNYIQIFEGKPVMDNNIAMYCGSVANPKTTKGSDEDDGNVLLVRLYLESEAKDEKVEFNATYTAFRTLDTKNNERCDPVTEFDCEDNTCIEAKLECDEYAHCRLKADEHDKCKAIDESMIQQPHILVILVIFSLILSGMSFVFLFKCIKKLVEDHKAIKKHLQESCEERLDEVVDKTLESARSSRSRQRASSERENHANELFKRRHMSPHQPTSIDSDFIQETHLDLDEEIWRREVDSLPIDPEDVRIEHNGRTRKKDISRKEESMRKDSRSTKEREEDRERKEIRDVSVGAPDTKESGCQTRESLFQAGTAASSDVMSAGGTDSGSGARGFSTFGYSGATLARPSPAPPVESSQITIELLRGHQDSQSRKSDRRPMSSETTRSAPDVIIVSKPIR